MRTVLLVAVATLSASLATPARAAMVVLGGGRAQGCYEAVEHGARDMQTLDLCTEALNQEPLSPKDRASTFVNRGVVLLRRQSYDEAAADFDRALAIRPNLGEAYANRGTARIGQHRYEEALGDLDRCLSIGTRQPEKCWLNKGLAHEAMGDVKSAYQDYRRAAELKPDWDLPKRELQRFSVRPAQG